ncbi:MAG: polyphosphate kinase 2 family protein [Actinomycetaceae bacterium]|nr:polyphosphate kinase 2 family protein [Actinomycetaceae bacterium]
MEKRPKSRGVEKQRRKEAIARAKKVAKQVKKAQKAAVKKTRNMIESQPATWTEDPRTLLRVGPDFSLASFNRRATPGWEAGKKPAKKLMKQRARLMAELQERLYAQSKTGASDALLVIVQGLDTAGKGGVARHVISKVDPQGIHLKAFKAPTEQERAHHFLWRVERELPKPGIIGLFDRSHYEDLLVPTAQARSGHTDESGQSWVVSEDELNSRYHDIYEMEKAAIERGTRVLKLCLMVSYEEQGKRLRQRLDRPDKYWKYSPHDLDVRNDWTAYQSTYEEVLRRTSTEIAPWYIIPADRKWYSRFVITEIITRTLADINPQWPDADFDIEREKARLALTMTDEALVEYQAENTDLLAKVAAEDAEVNTRSSWLRSKK